MLSPLSSWAQASWTIEVRGVVEESDKKLPNAVVSILANNQVVNSMTTPSGNFGFTLQGNMDYTITFTKPGYITKRLSFSTKGVPDDRAKYGFSAYSDIEVNIFPEVPGTDIDQILQQPIGKIGYDPKFHNGDFTYDEKYTESIQSLLDKILAAQKAAAEKARQLEAQYKKLITKADGEFNSKDYTNAKTDYTAALTLKPDEQYPKAQLAAIDKAIADQSSAQADAAKKAAAAKALQAKYDSLIKIGDANFKTSTWAPAKAAYTAALQVKPGEQYPQNQIGLINKAMADAAGKAAIQAKYDSLVKSGDAAFKTKKWADAKSAYNGALSVKSGEQYPKDQLAAIDKAMAADADAAKKAAIQAKYDSLVKIGDAAFKTKSWDNAKSAYNGALQVKSGEQYPKDQLAAIDKAIADAASAAQKAAIQAKYDSLVKVGDAAFKAKSWDNAKTAYKGALQVKSAEQYPKDQLAAIDKAIADAADASKKAAIQAKYDSLVKVGDAAFKTKSWNDAKAAYNGALQVKSTEQYPKDQLAAIDKAIASEADAAKKAAMEKAAQAKYDSLVKIGDAAFKTKSWANAKSAYNGALAVKSAEQYPKDQLAAIDKAMAADADAAKKATDEAQKAAAAKAQQAKYDSLVKIGDDAFKTKKWDNAKAAYNGALQVKSTEQYPKDQLAAIDKAIAADADAAKKAADEAQKAATAKAQQAKYDSLIKIGDAAFKTKSWTNAKAAYNGALQVKSSEQYPKDQLAAIDKAIADAAGAAQKAAMQAKYDSLIKVGDAAFKTKSWDNAKAAYNGALQVKSSEQYPKDQLAAIDKAIADAAGAAQKAAMQAKYDSLVKVGDAAFKTKSWDNAKAAYNGALQVKSSEQYPKDQLAAIDKAQAGEADAAKKAAMLKAMQAKYDSLVKIGDDAFKAKKWTDAKSAYNGALAIKGNEQYPKDQLAAIDKAMAADADAAQKAADAAQKAAAAKALQAKYDSLVKIGDGAFGSKDYTNAKSAYNAALGVKPNEQYPKDQLAAIDKALAADADASKKAAMAKAAQAKYDSLIGIADKAYNAKNYTPALAAYTKASQVKPTEQYPKDQIALINKAMTDQKAGDDAYNAAVAQGNQNYYLKQYAPAINAFKRALTARPGDAYATKRISEIQKLLSNDGTTTTITPVKPPKDSVKQADPATPDSIAAKYGPGVTEEHVDEPNCAITRRIVVKGNHGWIYTKKSWNFGTYFFKAGPPDYEDVTITEDVWNQETNSSK
jgi:hypothetical protein